MAKVITDTNEINDLLNSRYIEAIFPSKEKAEEILKLGKQLVFYLGIDPTSPNIHIGHTIPLLLLKQFSKLGHKIILLIGDFTAMIGDPDKEATRKALTKEEVKQNMLTYVSQVRKVLGKTPFEVKYNSEWLSKMSFEDVVRLASNVTVQQMIARDMFQERLKKEKPIFVHEFLYPLMQGYDSVAMKVDGEIGGNDQTFNMLVGRDLEKTFLNKEKLVFTTKLLVHAETGKKISKTEGGFVAVNDSPDDIFYNIMRGVPDAMVKTLFELATEIPKEWIEKRQAEVSAGENPKNFKEELAYELVKMYHGEKEAQKAKESFGKVYYEGQSPEKFKEVHGDGQTILETIIAAGIFPSKSEVKRLIDGSAVSIDGEKIKKWEYVVKEGDEIKIGDRVFLKVTK